MNTNRIEAAAATVATGLTGLDAFIQAGNHAVQFLVTLLTLAWWIRLWIKKPKVNPPGDYVNPK